MIPFFLGLALGASLLALWHDWRTAELAAERDFWRYMANRPERTMEIDPVERLLAEVWL